MTVPKNDTNFFLSLRKDDPPSIDTQHRTIQRWNNGAGSSGSIVQEKVFNSQCAAMTTSSLTAVTLTSIPTINFFKQYPGTTLRIKLQLSCFNSGTTAGVVALGGTVNGGAAVFMGQMPITPLNSHISTVTVSFDFSTTVYNNSTNGNILKKGNVAIGFVVDVSVNTMTFRTDTTDWYYVEVKEVAP